MLHPERGWSLSVQSSVRPDSTMLGLGSSGTAPDAAALKGKRCATLAEGPGRSRLNGPTGGFWRGELSAENIRTICSTWASAFPPPVSDLLAGLPGAPSLALPPEFRARRHLGQWQLQLHGKCQYHKPHLAVHGKQRGQPGPLCRTLHRWARCQRLRGELRRRTPGNSRPWYRQSRRGGRGLQRGDRCRDDPRQYPGSQQGGTGPERPEPEPHRVLQPGHQRRDRPGLRPAGHERLRSSSLEQQRPGPRGLRIIRELRRHPEHRETGLWLQRQRSPHHAHRPGRLQHRLSHLREKQYRRAGRRPAHQRCPGRDGLPVPGGLPGSTSAVSPPADSASSLAIFAATHPAPGRRSATGWTATWRRP